MCQAHIPSTRRVGRLSVAVQSKGMVNGDPKDHVILYDLLCDFYTLKFFFNMTLIWLPWSS